MLMNNLFALAADAATTTTGTENAGLMGGSLMSLLMFVPIILLMYFMMIRPQKKRQKEEQKMRESIRVGDELTTIGGIVGRVVTVKEDSLVIETGANCNKMVIKKWAVQSVDTVHDTTDDDDDDDDI